MYYAGWAASSCQCCHEPGTRRSWLFSARATSSGGLPGRTVTPYVHFIRAQLQQGLVIEKPQMIEMLYKEPTLAERFLTHMLTRNIRIEEDLIDQLFNSRQKRLARATARKTSRCGCRRLLPEILAETWAPRSRQLLHEQVPRARVHRIQRDITVNSSLLTVVLHDDSSLTKSCSFPNSAFS